MTLPASRVVSVTVSATAAPLERKSFGVPIYLQSTAKAGLVDADNRTRAYSSMEEIAAEWDAGDDFYQAAEAAFSQNVSPLTIKVAFYDATTATTAALLKDELDAILEADPDWYRIVPETALRDTALLDGLVEWVTATDDRFAIIDSEDPLMTDSTDTTNVAARHKGETDRVMVIWTPHAGEYQGMAAAAILAGYDFDQSDSAYTLAFKDLRGATVANVGSAAVNAVTGQIPGQGIDITVGHAANIFVQVGGHRVLLPGGTLTPNVFADQIHADDWMKARIGERVLNLKASNKRIPYTDVGLASIAGTVEIVGQAGRRAGFVSDDRDPITGDYASSFSVTPAVIDSATETMRQERIAPTTYATYRYAGAVQYSTIRVDVRF